MGMENKEQPTMEERRRMMMMHGHHGRGDGAFYALGFIGAAIYFIGQATTFGLGVLGFLKALVWPVFLVMAALKALGL